jgi:hypothetical protein
MQYSDAQSTSAVILKTGMLSSVITLGSSVRAAENQSVAANPIACHSNVRRLAYQVKKRAIAFRLTLPCQEFEFDGTLGGDNALGRVLPRLGEWECVRLKEVCTIRLYVSNCDEA